METFPKKPTNAIPKIIPIVPTMDVVVFPHMIVPLLVIDDRIVKGINSALEGSKLVFILSSKKQTTSTNEAIGTKDLYDVGTLASIMRIVKIPDGGIKILVQGMCKAKALEIQTEDGILVAQIEKIEMDRGDEEEIKASVKNIKDLAEKMATSGQSFSPDFHIILSKMQDPEKIADFIISHLNLSVEQSQDLLEKQTQCDLIKGIYHFLYKEFELSEVQERVRNNARDSMNKSQKEFYLREQLKAIKKELGEDDAEEIDLMREKLDALPLTEEVYTEIMRQVNRLEKTAPDSMEAAVIRNYLEWVLNLPWAKETVDNLDIMHAKKVLDEDHYGLKEIKDRILDFISIKTLKTDGYSPILCFVGPPGTGKTSLGKSIAKSLGREHFRISLGGIKDEAEIRGHRRTYVGAMPGRFIQGMRKAATCNPVIIIDELDKIGSDFRGDPSAAMLEVLDPQQNKTFHDNYLGIPFDLSKVMFIATANSIDSISEPLRDRMEMIHLSGYTQEEKLNIAKQHLVRKSIHDTGLSDKGIKIEDYILEDLIQNYTRESGVRELDRLIKKLCSKIARGFVENGNVPKLHQDNMDKFLGPKKFVNDYVNKANQVGISNGLGWTQYGGEMLKIEAILMPGKGSLILTGQLGDVMKESAQAAMSYARAHAAEFAIDQSLFTSNDIHVHFPAGGIPKDGPSAGITMLSAILSVLTKRPINSGYAMTGELNLQGDVMPIGGVKEKILAAKRNGIGHVILPNKNKNDLIGLEDVLAGIDIIFVESVNEVLGHVLMPKVS
ncbi:MAG: endopeptidase La [Candidatus Babeliales bacterium]|nr:endopeptidase La [Candidatus Babeliales bacterium]